MSNTDTAVSRRRAPSAPAPRGQPVAPRVPGAESTRVNQEGDGALGQSSSSLMGTVVRDAPPARRWALGVFQHRDFRLLWVGQLISNIGDTFGYLASIWLVKELTGSGLWMGTVLACSALASVLFGPIAGMLADRWQKREVMLVTDVVRFALVGLIGLASRFSWVSLPGMLGYAVLSGAASALFQPALQGSIISVVEGKELTQANSVAALTGQIAQMAGPVLAGITVAVVGVSGAFWVDAASFLVSAAALSLMRFRTQTARSAQPIPPEAANGRPLASGWIKQARHDLAEGIVTITQHPVLRMVIPAAVVANFLMGPLGVIMPMLASLLSVNGAVALGYLEGALGAGMLVGSLVMAALGQRWRKGWAAIAGILGIGLAVAALGVVRSVLGGSLAMAATGWFMMVSNIPVMTLLQESVKPDRQGRAFSVLFAGAGAARPLSMAAGGWLGDTMGVRPVLWLSGLLLLPVAGALAAVRPLREAR